MRKVTRPFIPERVAEEYCPNYPAYIFGMDELELPLEDRFLQFCSQFPGAEPIDPLITSEHRANKLKFADFLFEHRTIICEVKTLKKQTTDKLVAFMTKHGVHPHTLGTGEHDMRDVFGRLPDGESLYRQATDLIMTPVSDGFDEAQRQIRDTKQLFGIQSADGLLIILNEIVELAAQNMIGDRLKQRVKKNVDGLPYHRDVNRVFVVVAVNHLETPTGAQYVNMTLSNSRVSEAHGVTAFVERLATAWAESCSVPLTKAGPEINALMKNSKFIVTVG